MSRIIPIGHIVGAFGVQGWVKVKSETDPPENILKYSPWRVGDGEDVQEYRVLDGKRQANGVVARLGGITDRDAALALQGSVIKVPRGLFPPLGRGQYYWADLIGLEVRTTHDGVLGTLKDMIATGANDVMEVKGDRIRLIPFVMGDCVKIVDLDGGFLVVDWDPDF